MKPTLQGLALLDIALMAGIADWLGATQPVPIIVLVLVGMTAVAGVLVALSNKNPANGETSSKGGTGGCPQ